MAIQLTAEQVLAHIRANQQAKPTSSDKKGVGYNNRDNKENKENKENTDTRSASLSSCPEATPPSQATPSQAIVESILSPSQEVAKPEYCLAMEAPTPDEDSSLINKAFVHRALFTLYDNGESTTKSHQRYKFQVTINPADKPSDKHEFIGSLTKDLRNFKKYLPEGIDYEDIKQLRTQVKKRYGSYPYIGKLHYNHGRKTHSQRNQNEPYSFVAVYYNEAEKGWDFILNMYDWIHQGSLYDSNLTKKQESQNVKATDIWFNPDYEHPQINERNKTFADIMKAKKS